MERLIFHVDVNSAFLSWEAAKRVLEGKPDLRLIPSAITGERSKRRGVILAKSIPAKNFGVTTGEPVSMAKAKCPLLKLAEPDFCLYENCSTAFIEICRKYCPIVEKWSIDECFMDMSGMYAIYPNPLEAANKLKDEISKTLGFTVNIGISNNKLLAKMASDFEKPDKVHTLFSHEINTKLFPLPVRALFLAGRATAERLERAGIYTIGELAQSDVLKLKALIGVKAGQQLYEYANGLDSSPVLTQAERPKGYSVSTTLEEDVREKATAYNILLSLSESVASRMRADGAKAACIAVNIRSNTFKNSSRQMQLKTETDITSEIFSISKKLFCELWDKETPLRLLGIALTNLNWGMLEQASLFNDCARERKRTVDRTIDSIRNKFGADAIRRCSLSNAGKRLNTQEPPKCKED